MARNTAISKEMVVTTMNRKTMKTSNIVPIANDFAVATTMLTPIIHTSKMEAITRANLRDTKTNTTMINTMIKARQLPASMVMVPDVPAVEGMILRKTRRLLAISL